MTRVPVRLLIYSRLLPSSSSLPSSSHHRLYSLLSHPPSSTLHALLTLQKYSHLSPLPMGAACCGQRREVFCEGGGVDVKPREELHPEDPQQPRPPPVSILKNSAARTAMFQASKSSLTSDAFAYKQKQNYSTGMSGDSAMVKYETEEKGSLYSLDYRLYIKGPQGYISPWHDIPLYANEQKKIFNMIVEIPRWSNAKMEMATKEPLSPIKQDEKKGLPRFVHNIFPHHGYIWNYGALPQTWENNEHTDPETGAKGDNDPIDVVEIGSAVAKRGAVLQVKIVGCLALIDDGETDWKLMAIDVNDPLAADVNSMDDVEKHFPGLPRATYEWFRTYKIPTGKPANEFAFGGQFKDQAFCYKVIEETHQFWKDLIAQPSPALNTLSRVEGAAHHATPEASAAIVSALPARSEDSALPGDLTKWHFISDNKL